MISQYWRRVWLLNVELSLKVLDPVGRFSCLSLSACPALVSGGGRIKLKTDMFKPSNLAGVCHGHLLKWRAPVVSLL